MIVFPENPGHDRLSTNRVLSATFMETILDTAMDGIISMNEEQKVILFNRAAEAIFGWSADKILGQPIDLLIPARFLGDHRHWVEQFGRGLIQNRRMGVQRTVMALHASGHEFPIEASISQTSIDNQRIYTVILRDVTEAVRRRQQLEEQSQMLEQVSDAVSVVDPDGLIIFWNEGAHRLFGWTREEAIGKKSVDLLFRGDSAVLSVILASTNELGSWSGELTKTTRSGKSIIVDHRRTILKTETGKIKGQLCIDIDITSRKKQELLSHRSQRLESIGTLAGGIAHDLNNVLTPILMGAKLLSSGRAPANRQGLLDTLVASAQRGASLIQQLLAFAGGIQGERRTIGMGQLIQETRGLLEHTLPKSIRIETRIAADAPQVLGDATELTQILMNLCINARDAMPDGGTLVIDSAMVRFPASSPRPHPDAHEGTYLVVKVSDTGCGMTTEVLDRIFDPFFTTKEVGKGTGLGLATVQGIVKSHGGFILVYSEPNCGSTFSIYLPAANSAFPSDGGARLHRASKAGTGQLVLLVDDETIILQVAKAVLESHGYRTLSASDGPTAILQFEQHRQEVVAVLLDMMMPGMDGMQTMDRLLQIAPNLKIIACSGLGTSQREASALAAGASIFLPKPYTDDQLLDAVSRIEQLG